MLGVQIRYAPLGRACNSNDAVADSAAIVEYCAETGAGGDRRSTGTTRAHAKSYRG